MKGAGDSISLGNSCALSLRSPVPVIVMKALRCPVVSKGICLAPAVGLVGKDLYRGPAS